MRGPSGPSFIGKENVMYYGYETLESIERRYGCVQEYLRVQAENEVYEADEFGEMIRGFEPNECPIEDESEE